MKKIVRNSISFMVGLALVLQIVSIPFYEYRKYGDQFINNRAKITRVEAEEPDSFEVIILGDSTTCMGYSPLYLFKVFGITSYNCGSPFQWMKDSYDILQMVYPMQHRKVLVLDINNAYLPFNQWTKFIKVQLFNVFPVFQYHSVLMEEEPVPVIDDWKGYHCYTQENPGVDLEYMNADFPLEELPWIAELYLKKIYSFCQCNDIELILTSVPNPAYWNNGRTKAVETWASSHDVTYIDGNQYLSEMSISGDTDYMDAGEHMNISGSSKWMSYLGSVLKEKYSLTDYRGTDSEKEWDRAIEATGVYDN